MSCCEMELARRQLDSGSSRPPSSRTMHLKYVLVG